MECTAAGLITIETTGAPPPLKPTPKKKTAPPPDQKNPPLHRTDLGPRSPTIPPRNLETYLIYQLRAWSSHYNIARAQKTHGITKYTNTIITGCQKVSRARAKPKRKFPFPKADNAENAESAASAENAENAENAESAENAENAENARKHRKRRKKHANAEKKPPTPTQPTTPNKLHIPA